MTHLNTPIQYGATDARRSGVHELTEDQIKEYADIVGRMKVKMCDGMEYTFGFIVNRHRPEEDNLIVWRQSLRKPSFSHYGKSLLDGMFRNW